MPESTYTRLPLQGGPALFHDINALISGWDASRPPSDLIAELSQRCSGQLTANGSINNRRGKSMSRRKGQHGRVEVHGKFYTVRVRADLPGQEKRAHQRLKISPIKKGPGWLNKAQRTRKADDIIKESGVNSEAHFNEVVKQPRPGGITFREQSEIFMREMRIRDVDPVANSTLEGWGRCLENWLNPLLGDLPLSKINNGELKRVITRMKLNRRLPSTAEEAK